MPESVFNVAFLYLTFTCVCLKICESTDIKLHSLISNLVPECQIKVSTTFLESHNLQESNVPFEVIKLRLTNNTNISFLSEISVVFRFLPRPANRSNCAINFHYFRTNSNLKSDKEDISPITIFTYSVYISNSVIKARFDGEQDRYSYYPHNIWLLNAVTLRSLTSTEPFLVSQIFNFRRLNAFSIHSFRPSPELLNRLAVFSYTIKREHSRFCPTLAFESISNVERNCHNAHNLYSYMSQGDASVKEWKEKNV